MPTPDPITDTALALYNPRVQVKAAGGVRTLDAALDVIEAGATRIGATATAAILDEFARRQQH